LLIAASTFVIAWDLKANFSAIFLVLAFFAWRLRKFFTSLNRTPFRKTAVKGSIGIVIALSLIQVLLFIVINTTPKVWERLQRQSAWEIGRFVTLPDLVAGYSCITIAEKATKLRLSKSNFGFEATTIATFMYGIYLTLKIGLIALVLYPVLAISNNFNALLKRTRNPL
jgi:uncharacterized integral membrane protein